MGNGDYIISQNPSPNGRVYEWIAPDSNTVLRRGNFTPLIPLQAPQQKQMLTVGGEFPLSKNGKISVEFGYSRQDLNRYSSLDDSDNAGVAIKVNVVNAFPLGNTWTITPFASYEGSGSNFRTLDPYRNPEFTRDWNLPEVHSTAPKQLPSFGHIGIHSISNMRIQPYWETQVSYEISFIGTGPVLTMLSNLAIYNRKARCCKHPDLKYGNLRT